MKSEFSKSVQEAIQQFEHVHIEQSGVDSLLVHHNDKNMLTNIAKTLENKHFHSTLRENGTASFIEVINK
ncbi:hypothetical protein BAMA_19585 [Bacillus manliponensis]|uniref:Uncharacterized protein n=1 Tax=Bacillus manliponensis TaxID=574376 RepID=A0A073K0L5_9BACI|nr:hypothetical protein [Bacillus manliponensis]KEK19967.1 hypothetical protein BAMA_19585 [Bacillus manliponensis]